MSKIPEKDQVLVSEEEDEGNLYDTDAVWGVQEAHMDLGCEELGAGPELYIMSDRAYIVGGGADEAEYGEPGVEHSMAT
jgi:hypothetical protein